MKNWICSICGSKANYHSMEKKKHKYYCDFCWSKFILKLPFKKGDKNV